MELEWAGVPAVAIVHEAFGRAAAATAQTNGLADYEWVEVPYPSPPPGEWAHDQVTSLAAAMAPLVMSHLVDGGPKASFE